MSSIKDFLRWYNKTDVVPTFEAIQKLIPFYHDKNINMLYFTKPGQHLSICLHKSTDTKFYSFKEADEDMLEKIREDVFGGPSIVFIRKVCC